MSDTHGWHLVLYFNPQTNAGFVLVDREVRGVTPRWRAWAERFYSATRLAWALRRCRQCPDTIVSARYRDDGSLDQEDESMSQQEAEALFLNAVNVLTAKGAIVKINDRATKLIAERGM
jgi:hypothetical protein